MSAKDIENEKSNGAVDRAGKEKMLRVKGELSEVTRIARHSKVIRPHRDVAP